MRSRLGERMSLYVPATLVTTNGRELQATVLDISLSGLGLLVGAPIGCPLDPGDRVVVKFEPLGAGTGEFVLDAFVARVADARVGLMFAEFQSDLMLKIRHVVPAPAERSKAPLRALRWLRANARSGARRRRAAEEPSPQTPDCGYAIPGDNSR